jgi:benzodiazapine receptor
MMAMNRDTLRSSINLLAAILMVAVNGLAEALPLNGITTKEISDRFPVLFVPAAYVFSIWGLIYLGLIAFAIYQLLPAQRAAPRLRRVGYWFALSCLLNGLWIVLWHAQQFPATLLVMLALLASLIVIYQRLAISQVRVSAAAAQRWLVDLPFSIYLGWISVATIANAADVLHYLGWDGAPFGPQAWTILMLAAGLALAALMAFRRADLAYGLVVVWAFAGIALKQSDTPLVAGAAWLMAGLIVVVLVVEGVMGRTRRPATA